MFLWHLLCNFGSILNFNNIWNYNDTMFLTAMFVKFQNVQYIIVSCKISHKIPLKHRYISKSTNWRLSILRLGNFNFNNKRSILLSLSSLFLHLCDPEDRKKYDVGNDWFDPKRRNDNRSILMNRERAPRRLKQIE